jgi:hypothetical protein
LMRYTNPCCECWPSDPSRRHWFSVPHPSSTMWCLSLWATQGLCVEICGGALAAATSRIGSG